MLDVWTSPVPSPTKSGRGRLPAGLGDMGAEASAEAHPVVSGMNGATISILMRLKHAAMFEDFQVRAWREGRIGGRYLALRGLVVLS